MCTVLVTCIRSISRGAANNSNFCNKNIIFLRKHIKKLLTLKRPKSRRKKYPFKSEIHVLVICIKVSIFRNREERRKEREREREREGGERKEKKGRGEEARQTCYGCRTTPLELSKNYKRHETGEAGKMTEEETKKVREKDDRVKIWEVRIHVGSVFYSSIKPYLASHHYVNSIQVVGKKVILIVVLFFFAEYYRKVCIKPHKLSLKIARFL